MAEDAMITELDAKFDGNDNNNANANAIVAVTPPAVPLNVPPEDERTLWHLHISFRVGARVFVNIKGRDYNGEVKEKKNSSLYPVVFDESTPSVAKSWNANKLTVLPESWKEDPPARFLSDLKVSKRLKTRVSHYHGGMQFVRKVKSRHTNNTSGDILYIVDFDAGQELPFKSDKRFHPGHLQIGDSRQMAEIPRTKKQRKKVVGKKSSSSKSSSKSTIKALPTALSSATQPVATLPTSSGNGNGNGNSNVVSPPNFNNSDAQVRELTARLEESERENLRLREREKGREEQIQKMLRESEKLVERTVNVENALLELTGSMKRKREREEDDGEREGGGGGCAIAVKRGKFNIE